MRLWLILFLVFNINANRISNAINEIAWDIIDINYNIFSRASINTLVATAPFFILSLQEDKKIHSNFYYRPKHKNICQWPRWATHASSAITGSAIGINIALALFCPNIHLQKTAEMFAIGLPFANLVKNIFKRFKYDICLRPRNEYFHRYKVTYGGFPSGHMMIMSYVTSLYGLQYGPPAWVPLGLLSTYVFANYIVSNRHTTSQLVAGIALGTIYGISSSTVTDSRLAKIAKCCSISIDSNRNPCLNFNYAF